MRLMQLDTFVFHVRVGALLTYHPCDLHDIEREAGSFGKQYSQSG